MDTNQILRNAGYGRVENFGQIARYVAGRDFNSVGEVLAAVEDVFGPAPEFLTMRDEPVPYEIWGRGFEDETYDQMDRVCSIPPAIEGALMPDAHPGYGMPIGGVVALDNAISPSFVGYDIACRMTMSILDIPVEDFYRNRQLVADVMRQETRFGKGASFDRATMRDHDVMYDPLWGELSHLGQLRDLAWEQLGSSGGGNHFFDAMVCEVIGQAEWLDYEVGDQFVAVVTHSGSRGVGHKMATYYNKRAEQWVEQNTHSISGYAWLPLDTEAGQEYMQVMNLMGRYAQANHHLIHENFMRSSGIGIIQVFENHHNFAWEVCPGRIVHRKGATPAYYNEPGIIPGTSGTASYLVNGLGNQYSLYSSSHGAGRPFSRTEAKRRHDEQLTRKWYEDNDIWTYGLEPDETLHAYKDIEDVMAAQKDLVTPVVRMTPKIVLMGGTSDDGD